jgi:(2Fe-2S) ferredoxin
MVVVYPEAVWYAAVDAEKADRILAEHLVAGRPVRELQYHPEHAGNNKLPSVRELEARSKAGD